MLFFSEILKAHIVDNLNEIDGKVIDVLIRVEKDAENPEIIGLVVKNQGKKQFIPTDAITEWGFKKIKLNKILAAVVTEIPSAENIVSLNNAILDKQIVDLDGLKVVRVNDLQFGNIQQKMCLIAIDISTRGLLRRFGIDDRYIDYLWKAKGARETAQYGIFINFKETGIIMRNARDFVSKIKIMLEELDEKIIMAIHNKAKELKESIK